MLPRRSGRPPLGLLALILGVTIVPLATLLWLGWQLELKERELTAQQASQRVDQAADLVVAALQRAVAVTGQRVAAGRADWPGGAVVVTFDLRGVSVVPEAALAYYPVVEPLREAPASAFEEVDEFEFRNIDRARAIETVRPLARSRDAAVRATAIFRLAILQAADGRPREALATYLDVADENAVAMGGAPMALAAQYARCRILDGLGDSAALRAEAGRLAGDLRGGRWRLTEATYRLYAGDVNTWSGTPPGSPALSEVLAEAVRELWDRRDAWPRRAGSSAAPEVLAIQGQSLTILPQSGPGFTRALIAPPAFVQAEWLSAAAAIAREQDVAVALGAEGPSERAVVRRTAAQAELPWGITVRSLTPAPSGFGAFDARRQLLAAGLAVLVVVCLFASYVVARAVNRELAVARLQSDFVAAVSHEFRTPLTSLRQFTDMLREGAARDDEQRGVCYEAQSRATDRLTRLVESLLDFGRMEAGARSYHFERVNCVDVVQSVVDECRQDIQAAGYVIELRHEGATEIEADREALGRALRNLLENAVKYSPDHRTVEVGVTSGATAVSISVQDHGIGVPAAERKAIFNRFQRGAEARTRGIKGTGLGLAMVHHIVRAHRGRVRVESAPGEGSRFTIELPVKA